MGGRVSTTEHGIERGPQLRLPFADIGGPIASWDMGPCTTFNLDYYDCQEAYGPTKGKVKCQAYWQDFMECAHKEKQLRRVVAMRNEREKQFAKGILGMGPRVPFNAARPPDDSYLPDPIGPEI